jgi:hypothetical protein
MKKLLLLSFAALLIAGNCYAQTPPRAASTQTWTFGEQVWSDAIRMPRCDKSDFIESYTFPDCRSYTDGNSTWYYYNWAYVEVNKKWLCPAPWRVPTKDDFEVLIGNTTPNSLIEAWGLPGIVYFDYKDEMRMLYVEERGRNWSMTDYSYWESYAIEWGEEGLQVRALGKMRGLQVRCVR